MHLSKKLTLVTLLVSCLSSVFSKTVDLQTLQQVADSVLNYRQSDSLRARNSLSTTQQTGEYYYELGDFHWVYDNLDSAIFFKSKAEKLFDASQQFEKQCKALRDLAWIKLTISQYSQSMEFLLRARQVYNRFEGDSANISQLNKMFGTLYNYQGDYQKSRTYYEKSLKYFEKQGCSDGLSSSYNCLAIQAYDENNFEEELQLTIKAFHCANQLERSDLYIRMALNLGNIYSRRTQYDSAHKYFNYALEGIKESKSKNLKNISLTLLHLAWTNLQQENIAQSKEFYLLAEKWVQKTERKKNLFLCRVYKGLSKIATIENEHVLALEFFKKYSDTKQIVDNKKASLQIIDLENQFLLDKEINKQEKLKATSKNQQLTIAILLLAVLSLILLYWYKKKIYKANIDIVKKNIEITELEKDEKDSMRYISSSLEEEKKSQLLEQLTSKMKSTKIYLNSELSVGMLADELHTNQKYLSQVINEKLKVNFSTYINQYRIKEARHLMTKSEFQNFTIEAIAKDVGFNSISAFNTAFKKYAGITPSFYLKQIKASSSSTSH